MSDQDILWEIAKEVAKDSDTVCNNWDNYECPFCGEEDSGIKNNFKIVHNDTCIVTKARKLVKEREGQKNDTITQ